MTAITFDTLSFTRRLREAGFDERQAETVVRVLADAQDKVVTKEYLDFKLEAVMSELKLVKWMLALVVAANVMPLLARIFN
ncbi:MAG: hypothetical protein Q8O31_03990 [Rhodocyclaceae bacterium]|nr:hypothetical protein [Rhodocyclaceae bacterium]